MDLEADEDVGEKTGQMRMRRVLFCNGDLEIPPEPVELKINEEDQVIDLALLNAVDQAQGRRQDEVRWATIDAQFPPPTSPDPGPQLPERHDPIRDSQYTTAIFSPPFGRGLDGLADAAELHSNIPASSVFAMSPITYQIPQRTKHGTFNISQIQGFSDLARVIFDGDEGVDEVTMKAEYAVETEDILRNSVETRVQHEPVERNGVANEEKFEENGVVIIDDQHTDSGYRTRLGSDTASVISCDSNGPWSGIPLNVLQDLIRKFTDLLLETPCVADLAGAAATMMPPSVLETKVETKVAGLLKNFSLELLPLARVDQDSKKKTESCLFIRRNRERIARCFRERASTAATAEVFEQLKSSNKEVSLNEKMSNWEVSSDMVYQDFDDASDDDENDLPIDFSDLPIDISDAKEFLISSPPFQRLIERFQALYYDRDEKISAIRSLMTSNSVLTLSGQDHATATFRMTWDIPTFMKTRYDFDSNVKLKSVITISGSALYSQATTMRST
jgi:hypothetical protein